MTDGPFTRQQALQRLEQVERLATAIVLGPNLARYAGSRLPRNYTDTGLLARLSLSEAVLSGPNLFADPLEGDRHITGKVGGRAKFRGYQPLVPAALPNRQKGTPNMVYPASRPFRPQGPDGGRSFHMRETRVFPPDSRRPAAPRIRTNYLLDGAKVPLAKAGLGDLAHQRGLYLFREDAKAEHKGSPLALTNMGRDDAEIERTWKLIAANETRRIKKFIEPHIVIDKTVNSDRGFWGEVRSDPEIPASLAQFLDDDHQTVATFTGKEFEAISGALRRLGWHPKGRKKCPSVRFHAGRRPILQRRLVLELPAGLSLDAVQRTITKLAEEFRGRHLPFVLVVHKPNEANHEDNWHIHLDYHHRPIQRFFAATYRLAEAPSGVGTKAAAQRKIAEDALANPDPAWEGMWDCEIEVARKTKCGHSKASRPFLQEVHGDLRPNLLGNGRGQNDGWLKILRVTYAKIVNEELEQANSPVRFDPATFEERGIDKVQDVHLGLTLTRLERNGYLTKEGAINEANQWAFEMAQLRKQFPGGHEEGGSEKNVKGYVRAKLELIRTRLESRAEKILYYANRESNSFNDPERSQTTARRDKRSDFRPELLVEPARDTLFAIKEMWERVHGWFSGLDEPFIDQDTSLPALPAAEYVPAERATPIRDAQAKPTPNSETVPEAKSSAALSTSAASISVASKPRSSTIEDNNLLAKQTVARPSPSSDEIYRRFVSAVEKRKVRFEIDQAYVEGDTIFIATVPPSAPWPSSLPRRVVARGSLSRRELLALRERIWRETEASMESKAGPPTAVLAQSIDEQIADAERRRRTPEDREKAKLPPQTSPNHNARGIVARQTNASHQQSSSDSFAKAERDSFERHKSAAPEIAAEQRIISGKSSASQSPDHKPQIIASSATDAPPTRPGQTAQTEPPESTSAGEPAWSEIPFFFASDQEDKSGDVDPRIRPEQFLSVSPSASNPPSAESTPPAAVLQREMRHLAEPDGQLPRQRSGALPSAMTDQENEPPSTPPRGGNGQQLPEPSSDAHPFSGRSAPSASTFTPRAEVNNGGQHSPTEITAKDRALAYARQASQSHDRLISVWDGIVLPEPRIEFKEDLKRDALLDPLVQRHLKRVFDDQTAYFEKLFTVLRPHIDAGILRKGNEAILAQLPDSERQGASEWSDTRQWNDLMDRFRSELDRDREKAKRASRAFEMQIAAIGKDVSGR